MVNLQEDHSTRVSNGIDPPQIPVRFVRRNARRRAERALESARGPPEILSFSKSLGKICAVQ